MKTKTFDCVEMKWAGSRHVYEQIKDLSPAEELAFWKECSGQLKRRIKAAKTRRRERSVPRNKK